MKNIIMLFSAVVIIMTASCGRSNKSESRAVQMMNVLREDEPSSEKITVNDDRKIIKSGNITFETSDTEETRKSITNATKELGGYISTENSIEFTDREQQTIEIRIPAENFDKLLTGVTSTAIRIDSRNITAQDVTEDYIDLEARLKTKKELEDRYKQLLAKATKVEEMMSIEREIGKLREEIESAEGRYRYLTDRVAFSSLNVTFYKKISKPFRFSSRLGQSFDSGWKFFLTFLTGIVSLWPFLLLTVTGLFLAFRIKRKNRSRNQSAG